MRGDYTLQCQRVVIASTATMGDMNLLQGLGALYTRKSTTAALLQYVGAYIAVQAVIYAGSWTGPPSANFLGFNQTAALAALLGVISLPMTSATHAPTSRRAAILEGSVGGGVAVLTMVAVLGFLRFRRHRIRTPSTPLGASLESGMNPSTSTTPPGSASNTGLGPQAPMAEDTSISARNPSESMVAVSDPTDLSTNAGFFFPRAQNFVVAGGHFTNNIINLSSPTSPDFRSIQNPLRDVDLRRLEEMGSSQTERGMGPVRRISSAEV
ncbi:hypothetical protein DFH08DRAFT_811451 [Mycena albidolilacea]|uniref:Uncharacterized protein n=1 Tax=Mycena albidolilacea TaxID=1033008 RepID=A0AAD6ZVH8_9AGAR|nr:hypothetical protein DFH08DRAFT_811451 [Mycena albidolilacea]